MNVNITALSLKHREEILPYPCIQKLERPITNAANQILLVAAKKLLGPMSYLTVSPVRIKLVSSHKEMEGFDCVGLYLPDIDQIKILFQTYPTPFSDYSYINTGFSYFVDTFLHEIAHHLAFKLLKSFGHDKLWLKCLSILGLEPVPAKPQMDGVFYNRIVNMPNQIKEELFKIGVREEDIAEDFYTRCYRFHKVNYHQIDRDANGIFSWSED